MKVSVWRRLGRTDWSIVVVVLALLLFGLTMIYSASYHFYMTDPQMASSPAHFFWRQVRFCLLGLGLMLIAWNIDYHLYDRLAIPILILTGLVLTVMAFVGRWLVQETAPGAGGGARALIKGSIQPVEAAKLGAIIYMAAWLKGRGTQLRTLNMGLLPFAVLIATMLVLILFQRDLSTAMLLFSVTVTMFYVAGATSRQVLFLILAIGLILAIVIWGFGYNVERTRSWFEGPFADPYKTGFQTIQALQALNRGGFFGVGLGRSVKKLTLRYVCHTDFIYAIIGEEWGLLGTIVTVALYGLWAWRGLRIAHEAPDRFGRLIAVGIVSWVVYQATLHIAAVTHTTPITGTVLPFISSGGSSLVSLLAAIGILLNISRDTHYTRDGQIK